jgi:hypothetical protein
MGSVVSVHDQRVELCERLSNLAVAAIEINNYDERMAHFLSIIADAMIIGTTLGQRGPWRDACSFAVRHLPIATPDALGPTHTVWEQHVRWAMLQGLTHMGRWA